MARNTKANRILNESAMRLEAARMRHHLAHTANAVFEAVQAALQKELTPTPRKPATKKPAADTPAPKEPQPGKEPKCGVCYEVESHSNHDMRYLSSHKFDPPKSVARAPRKSRQKTEEAKATPSSEIGKDAALGVGASAGD
jgi:hypothetical protein